MKFRSIFAVMSISLAITGCTVISGLQTYDLPSQGSYTTNLGVPVNVIALNQDTLPANQTAQELSPQYYAPLFHSTKNIYTLTPGDVLSVQLWNYPEISPSTSNISSDQSALVSGYPIDQQGYVQLPLVGRHKVSEKTLSQINTELKVEFSRYLKQPDLIVRIVSYQGQRYYVQGNVNKSGQFSLTDQPTSLYTALGMAGGITQLGDPTYIQLIRHGKIFNINSIELEKQGLSLHKLMIQPNDMIYVNARDNKKIYVMGEAGKNQSILIRDQGMSLSDVLGESLGLNPLSASAARIYVLRSNNTDHTTAIYHLNLNSIGNFGLANQFKMQSNDIVYVDPTGLVRWQRVLSQIVPFSNAIYSAKLAANQ
ncbi:polysaccharide biosynthesis/export family protein [Acinetobacter sp. ANC 5383]